MGKIRKLLSGYKLDDNEKDKTSQVKNIIVLFSHYIDDVLQKKTLICIVPCGFLGKLDSLHRWIRNFESVSFNDEF